MQENKKNTINENKDAIAIMEERAEKSGVILSSQMKKVIIGQLENSGQITKEQADEAIAKLPPEPLMQPQPARQLTHQEIWAYGNRKARRHMEAIAKKRIKKQ